MRLSLTAACVIRYCAFSGDPTTILLRPGQLEPEQARLIDPERSRIMIKVVVGSFDSVAEATEAARHLRSAGFLDGDINIIANNTQRGGDCAMAAKHEEDEASGAAMSAVAGGALGGVTGIALSLLGLTVPGIGSILAAGPIVTALAAAGAGAVAGGLIGSLTDLGVPKTEAECYAEAVRRGGGLVTVRADLARATEAERIMRRHGAYEMRDRVEQWRSSGWAGHDPDAAPYTFDQIERDRTRYRTSSPRGAEFDVRR
jgi:hypothetical protein